jgi:hypothetical protein
MSLRLGAHLSGNGSGSEGRGRDAAPTERER